MATIVSYDVDSKHAELKAALIRLGYADHIPGTSCKIIYFPNTTLYHSTKTASQSRDDVQKICKQLQIELERCVSTTWENYAAICGEPHS